jgi:hypothetical protein
MKYLGMSFDRLRTNGDLLIPFVVSREPRLRSRALSNSRTMNGINLPKLPITIYLIKP